MREVPPNRATNLSREAVVLVDEDTGAKKNTKLARIALIDPEFRWILGEVMGAGAIKYGEDNYKLHRKTMLPIYYDALERHIALAQLGERLDPDSGQPHMAHVAATSYMIWWLETYGDD